MIANLKQSITSHIAKHYQQKSEVPSIRMIVKHFKKDGLSTRGFYQIFPEGLAEACRLAEVPAPSGRVAQTSKASKTVKREERESVPAPSSTSGLVLTEEQSQRVFGICHLEGGSDPHKVINDLLDLDTQMRGKYHLNLSQISSVLLFVSEARRRGWKDDVLVDYLIRLWNSGLKLKPEAVQNLQQLLSTINLAYWGSPENFANYASSYALNIGRYQKYLQGSISLEEFLQAEGL
jgi:hypothetical protein